MFTYLRAMTLDEFLQSFPENDNLPYDLLDCVLTTTPVDSLKTFGNNDYQGTALCLLFNRITKQYGLLSFSYGSCELCDSWLSAINYGEPNYDELLDLRNSTFDSIIWFDNLKDISDYAVMRLEKADKEEIWMFTSEIESYNELVSFLSDKVD